MKVGTDGVLLGAWSDVSEASTILDIGTGTGLVALMLAQRNEEAQVTGIEINSESAQEAEENFKNSAWADRLFLKNAAVQDLLDQPELHRTVDHVVCNPPFFSGGTMSKTMDRNVVRHTTKLPHQDLLRVTQKLLRSKGKFSVILPTKEGIKFKELAVDYGFSTTRETEVRSRTDLPVERLLLEFVYLNAVPQPITNQLIIRSGKEADSWTQDYLELTKEFYLFA